MTDRGGEFSFFQGIHVRFDIRIDISISVRIMTTKLGKEVHLQELTQVRLIKRVLVTSSRPLEQLKTYLHLAGWKLFSMGFCP